MKETYTRNQGDYRGQITAEGTKTDGEAKITEHLFLSAF